MFFIVRFVNPATNMGNLVGIGRGRSGSFCQGVPMMNFALRWLATKEWGCSYWFAGVNKERSQNTEVKKGLLSNIIICCQALQWRVRCEPEKKGDGKMMFHVFSSGHFQNSGCNSRKSVLGIPNHSIVTKRQVVGSSDGLFLFGTAGPGSKTMTSCMEMVHLYELLPRKVQEIHCKRIHRHLDHSGKWLGPSWLDAKAEWREHLVQVKSPKVIISDSI